MGIENRTIESLTALSKSAPTSGSVDRWFAALEEEHRDLIHMAMEVSGIAEVFRVIASDEENPFPFSYQTLRRYQRALSASIRDGGAQ